MRGVSARPGARETKLLADMASQIYSWLPGSSPGSAYTFADAAAEVGFPGCWVGGSKEPAIQQLLECVWTRTGMRPLMGAVLREGIKYRQRTGNPLTRPEVKHSAALLQSLGLRAPDFEDRAFLDALPAGKGEELPRVRLGVDPARLKGLLTRFGQLDSNPDHQGWGYELQDLLQEVLDLYELRPRKPFRNTGQEIDGSFVLDNEIYLLEARWRKEPSRASDLLAFKGKVAQKTTWSRGVFVSVGGFAAESFEGVRGEPLNFVAISGRDLKKVLEGAIRLDELTRERIRGSGETGRLEAS